MHINRLLLIMSCVGVLAACDPQNVKNTGGEQQGAGQNNSGVQVGGLQGRTGQPGQSLLSGSISYEKGAINDPNNVLAEKVIYFEYNSEQISAANQELISHHGKYLAANPGMQVRLEGHADERGSREYNVALGNRRAQAVRRLVLFQGMKSEQLEVISWGEEKPFSDGHDEASWRLNRRVELVYEAR